MRAILSKMKAYAYFMMLDIKGIVNLWTYHNETKPLNRKNVLNQVNG
jgi:hypothetical protein